MKKMLVVLGLAALSVCLGQYLEKTIRLPDSLGGVMSPMCVVYGDSDVFVAGYGQGVLRIDTRTMTKTGRAAMPYYESPSMVYCRPHDRLYVIGGRNNPGGETTLVAIDANNMEVVAVHVLGRNFTAVLYNPISDRVYCGGPYSQSVFVFDAGTSEPDTVIWVPNGVSRFCLDSVQNRLYGVDSRGGRVLVFNGENDSLVYDWQVGQYPEKVVYNTTDNKAYCLSNVGNFVAVLDGVTLEPGPRFSIVSPIDLCWDRVGDKVYCGNVGAVHVYSGANDSFVAVVPIEHGVDVLLHGPVSNRVYCHNYSSGMLYVIDANADTIVSAVPGEEYSDAVLCFDPGFDRVYRGIHDYRGTVQVIDGAGNGVLARISTTGDQPSDLCVNPVTNRIYTANSYGTVTVIDGDAQEVLASLDAGLYTYAVACAWDLDKVYCAFRLDTSAYLRGWLVVEGATNEVADTLWTPESPEHVVYNPTEHKLYFSDGDEGVHVLDCVRDTVYRSILLGRGVATEHLAYCPTENKVYCAAVEQGVVAAIDCATDRVVGWVFVGYGPGQMVCNSRSNRLYCPVDEDSGLVVVDCVGDTVVGVVEVHDALAAVCDPLRNEVYVTSYDDSLYVVDASADTVVSRVFLGDCMELLAVDTIASKVYVSDGYRGPVKIYDPVADSIVTAIDLPWRVAALVANPADTRVYVPCRYDCSVAVLNSGPPGVAEMSRKAVARQPSPTIVHGTLFLPQAGMTNDQLPMTMLDIAGRKVMDLKPGSNDIRHLAPGVYFVRTVESGKQSAVRKVVVQR